MLSRMGRKPLTSALADKASLPAIYLTATILAYLLFSQAMYRPHLPGGDAVYPYLLLFCLVIGSAGLSYSRATPSFRILTRSVIAFALFYVVTSHVPIADSLIGADRLARFELNQFWIVATLCGIAGFFRPSFGLVPLLYIPWQKHQLMHLGGLPIDWLDHFTLIESGSFLILGYVIFGLFCRVSSSFESTAGSEAAARADASPLTSSLRLTDVLVLLAIALHFGNYFYAGLIKTTLGGSPVHWILHNRTEILVLAAWDSGVLPISFSTWLPGFTYELISNVRVFSNLATIGIQLLAVIAIVRIRWAVWITLTYDALHVLIFLTTGIFFWKFIVLNLAIVAALSAMKIQRIPRNLKTALISAVICSPFVFHIMPSFAWLDTPSVNQARLYAVTEDGAEYRVPSNYFLGSSITLAQNRMIWPERGPFPTATWGTTRNAGIARRGLACDWADDASRSQAAYYVPKEHIEEVVRRNHTQILSMVDAKGFVDYDLFPHHIFSMPWGFEDFKKLDKRLIRSYRYESEAVCLGYQNGEITRKRMYYSTFEIAL